MAARAARSIAASKGGGAMERLEAAFGRLERKLDVLLLWLKGITFAMITGFVGMFVTIMLTR